MWFILLLLLVVLAFSYVWFSRPWQCLWWYYQRVSGKRYQLWIEQGDALPGKAFVAVCSEPTLLMAILLRRLVSSSVIYMVDQPVGGFWLNHLLSRNAIRCVSSIDTLVADQQSVLLVSLQVYEQYRQQLRQPLVFVQACGEAPFSKQRHRAKQGWLQFSLQLSDRQDKASLTEQWQYFDAHCWQRYVPKLPGIIEQWLYQAKAGGNRLSIADTTGAAVSHRKLLVAVKSMHDHLATSLADEQRVGICLPPSVGGSIAMLVLLSLGKTLVYLNYTASREAIMSAVESAQIQHVITSKKFLQGLEDKGFDLSTMLQSLQLIYLEDVKAALTKSTLLKNALMMRLMPLSRLKPLLITPVSMGDTAVILFSSGSEGKPKGVELSHENIVGNIKQSVTRFSGGSCDVVAGILPTFHAFGFTITGVLPMIEGGVLACHPDPRDAEAIGKLVQQYQVTIMCATSTFYRLYARSRHIKPEMFASLRFVVAGAEKLQPEVATLFEEKFKKIIYEGYGTTELSPVVAVNRPDTASVIRHERGTIGQTIAGCIYRVIDPDTHQALPVGQAGMLTVGGVNVMKGYLHQSHKTREVVISHQGLRFYLTGDKAKVDGRGFATILDRYSRFVKLGGEMISLSALERQVADVINHHDIEMLAVGIPSDKKGEMVVLLVAGDVTAKAIQDQVMQSDMHNLMKPQHYCKVDAIPKLGSGKTDFSAAKQLAQQLIQ